MKNTKKTTLTRLMSFLECTDNDITSVQLRSRTYFAKSYNYDSYADIESRDDHTSRTAFIREVRKRIMDIIQKNIYSLSSGGCRINYNDEPHGNWFYIEIIFQRTVDGEKVRI